MSSVFTVQGSGLRVQGLGGCAEGSGVKELFEK